KDAAMSIGVTHAVIARAGFVAHETAGAPLPAAPQMEQSSSVPAHQGQATPLSDALMQVPRPGSFPPCLLHPIHLLATTLPDACSVPRHTDSILVPGANYPHSVQSQKYRPPCQPY